MVARKKSSSEGTPSETATSLITGRHSLAPVPIPKFWNENVPRYESKSLGFMIVKLVWNPIYAMEIEKISQKRAANRYANYVDPKETERVNKRYHAKSGGNETSIRFGVKKEGHGYHGKERGDFCLVGGVVKPGKLLVFYRSLELIGGFAYDLTLFRQLELDLAIRLREVVIIASHAQVFALKGNSNEKLFPKLQSILK